MKWILCEDKKPSDDDIYIVSIIDDGGDSEFCYTYTGWYIPEIDKWVVDDTLKSNIIAWMPLPEPYERPLVKCPECQYLEFHDMDGICGKNGKIVQPWHSCRKGKQK